MKLKYYLTCIFLFFIGITYAQVNMSDGSSTTCSETFFDSGGSGSNYSDSETLTYTFTPSNSSDKVSISFTSFDVEDGWDYLYVYNGPDDTAPLVAELTGNTLPADITSSATGGELTFVFESDGSVNEGGWEATISCVTPAAPDAPGTLTFTPLSATSVEVSWDAVNNNGSAITDYTLEYKEGVSSYTVVSAGTDLTETIAGLTEGAEYTFRVKATNANGDSPYSVEQTFTPLGGDISVTIGGSEMTSGVSSYDFGTAMIGYPAIQSFIIENAGGENLTLDASGFLSISGTNAVDFINEGDSSGYVIPAGELIIIDLAFNPITAGSKTATVTISSDDGDEAAFAFDVTGTAVAKSPDCEVPGAGFETSFETGVPTTDFFSLTGVRNYQAPTGWDGLLSKAFGIFDIPVNVELTADANSGSNALRLFSDVNGIGDVTTSFKCDTEYTSLKGFYKFSGAGLDSAIVAISSGGYGNATDDNSDTLYITADAGTYTEFSLSIPYDVNSVDSLVIYLTTTTNGVATEFLVDDLSLEGGSTSFSNTEFFLKNIGGNGSDFLQSFIQLPDDSFIAVFTSNSDISGTRTEANLGGNDYWITRISSDGQVINQKAFGGSLDERVSNIITLNDGNHLIVGTSKSDASTTKSEDAIGEDDIWLVKIDSDFNIIWENTIGTIFNERVTDVDIDLEGNIYLAAYSGSPIENNDKEVLESGFWLVKLDQNGDKVWERVFSDFSFSGEILVTTSNEVLITTNSQGVKKIDASGNLVWESFYSVFSITELIETSANSFVLSGRSTSGFFADVKYVEIDINGEVINQSSLIPSGSVSRSASDVVELPSGALAFLVGSSSSSFRFYILDEQRESTIEKVAGGFNVTGPSSTQMILSNESFLISIGESVGDGYLFKQKRDFDFYSDDDEDFFGNPGSTTSLDTFQSGFVFNDNDCDDTDANVVGSKWYLDNDDDGFGTTEFLFSCTQPVGYADQTGDCNDGNDLINPNSEWFLDNDDDGFGDPLVSVIQCEQPAGYVINDSDCDDDDSFFNPNTVWYADMDNDGFGDPDVTLQSCTQPVGYVLDNTDCADDDINFRSPVWYRDLDGDGFGNAEETSLGCTQPTGFVDNSDDCDDSNTAINPQTIWYADTDDDGFGDLNGATQVTCEQPEGFVLNSDDCDDSNADINPNLVWYEDADGDGSGNSNSTTTACEQPIGFVSNPDDCDDADFNFDFFTLYLDNDGDGYGQNEQTIKACGATPGYAINGDDCDDTNAAITPLTTWYADTDGDGFGDINDTFVDCEQPTGYVLDNTDCDDADENVGGEQTWYEDADNDGFGNANNSQVSCTQPIGFVLNDTDCDDSNANFNAEQTWYLDADGDGLGNPNLSVVQCLPPQDYVLDNTDCDDNFVGEPTITLLGDLEGCDELFLEVEENYSRYEWSKNDIIFASNSNPVRINSSGDYTLTITTNGGCEKSETFSVTLTTTPITSIGADRTICLGEEVTSNTAGVDYLWSTGETTQSIQPQTSGTYSVTVSSGGCSFTDEVDITIADEPTFKLDDLTVCLNSAYSLEMPSGFNSSYNWYRNGSLISGGRIFNGVATTEGTIEFVGEVFYGSGCRYQDTLLISVISDGLTDNFLENNLSVCAGESFFAPEGFASYEWSDGSTGIEFNPPFSGNFQLTVTTQNGCTATEAFSISIFDNPIVDLGPDRTICPGEEIFTNDVNNQSVVYEWSDGVTGRTRVANEAGLYILTALNLSTGCSSTDSVNVTFQSTETIDIGPDISTCLESSITLDLPDGFTNYRWQESTGGIFAQQSLTIRYSNPGEYFFIGKVDNISGCTISDTVFITVSGELAPLVALPVNPNFCNEGILDAGPGFASYLWNDGSTEQTLTVTESGTYSVTVTNSTGCSASAETFVNINQGPAVNAGEDLSGCTNESFTLTPSGEFDTFIGWSDRTGGIFPVEVFSVEITSPGVYPYVAIAENSAGCRGTDTLFITVIEVPISSFEVATVDSLATFTNQSEFAESLLWDFGDGNTSEEENPEHIYDSPGTYTVTLDATNGCSTESSSTEISVEFGSENPLAADLKYSLNVYPNPVKDLLKVYLEGYREYSFKVFGLDGTQISGGQLTPGQENSLDLSQTANGVYLLQIESGEKTELIRIIKKSE